MAPSPLKDFGDTAQGLSRNPLGIIALFIVLVYAFASTVVAFGSSLDAASKTPLIWFMVGFPVLVLIVFAWLVSQHTERLYAPGDYDRGEFVAVMQARTVRSEVRNLASVPSAIHGTGESRLGSDVRGSGPLETREAPRGALPGDEDTDYREELPEAYSEVPPGDAGEEAVEALGSHLDLETPEGRSRERNALYLEFRGVFIVHVLTPSEKQGQDYDIFIYVMRHGNTPIYDITKAEFFFGQSWGNRIFEGRREGDVIGVRTAAYGSFLCTCLVTFMDGSQVSLYRYIDFEMGSVADLAAELAAGRHT